MRTLLGVFLILVVSGDDETIYAHLEDNVLLPCSCPERSLDKDLKWQIEDKKVVLTYNAMNNGLVQYNGNVRVFLHENSDNCSVLLINVTLNDQGRYRCSFISQGTYKRVFLNLIVRAKYKVCQKGLDQNLTGAQGFQCDAEGNYPEAEIQWSLDGQPLTATFNANITHSKWLEATGLYRFSSTLIIKHNGTTQPTCNVTSERVLTRIEEACNGVSDHVKQDEQQDVRQHYVKMIPIILLLVVLLALWRSFRSRGVIQR